MEGRISKVHPSSTRTSDGKKIDTWRVKLPDGQSEITVNLHSTGDSIHFTAKGTHSCIKGLSWEGSDLALLRSTVMEDVEKAARRHFKSDWEPAVSLDVSLYKTDRGDTSKVQISLEVVDIHIDPSRPMGNQGDTHILKGQVPTVMVQRSHDQTFECSGSLDRENMIFSRERGNTVARSIVDGDQRAEVLALASAMEAFSIKLMRRTSPDMMKLAGVPTPEDLIEIMTSAIEDPENEEKQETDFKM
jgi:hypothetical protein